MNTQPRCKTVSPVTHKICNQPLWGTDYWCQTHGDLADQPNYSREAHYPFGYVDARPITKRR